MISFQYFVPPPPTIVQWTIKSLFPFTSKAQNIFGLPLQTLFFLRLKKNCLFLHLKKAIKAKVFFSPIFAGQLFPRDKTFNKIMQLLYIYTGIQSLK